MDAIFEKPRKSIVRLYAGYLDKLLRMKKRTPQPFGTYYEFGTGWGGTLGSFMLAAEQIAVMHKLDVEAFRVFAFDSFKGLPPTDHPADRHGNWAPGAFANSVEVIQGKLNTHPFAKRVPITYVEGYFEHTLTDELVEKLKAHPPSIITVDVDFYTSTQAVLSFVGKFAASGALLYFDDMWSFHGHPDYGQPRAIREFASSGAGYLVPFDTYGEAGKCFLYSRNKFEFE